MSAAMERAAEARGWYPAAYAGECDRCHGSSGFRGEWADDEPGDWVYCLPCAAGYRQVLRPNRGSWREVWEPRDDRKAVQP